MREVRVYDNYKKIMDMPNCGKVVINLCTNDLKQEYQRIKELGIGAELSEIRYINA